MTTGGAISRLIDKFKWLPFVGAAVICFAATRMILEDKFIEPRLGISLIMITVIEVVVGILVPAVILLLNKLRERRATAKTDTDVKVSKGIALAKDDLSENDGE
jgi:predicted tellurium resistance membrane protein TerC